MSGEYKFDVRVRSTKVRTWTIEASNAVEAKRKAMMLATMFFQPEPQDTLSVSSVYSHDPRTVARLKARDARKSKTRKNDLRTK